MHVEIKNTEFTNHNLFYWVVSVWFIVLFTLIDVNELTQVYNVVNVINNQPKLNNMMFF